MTARRISPAFERNREPILGILSAVWNHDPAHILEIASGPGQHAVYFSQHLPHVTWQPTEGEPALLDSIRAWSHDAPHAERILPPIHLKIGASSAPPRPHTFQGALAVNFLHMVGPEIVEPTFALVSDALSDGGRFVVYDCFTYDGEHVSASNAHFDQRLRANTPGGRVHAFESVDAMAARHHLVAPEIHWLPANNQCVVWTREGRS